MKVSDNIFLVGSGDAGLSISDSSDCSVYLIDDGNSCCLIDAGSGINPDLIIRNIENDGIDPSRVNRIFLTHGHGDHAGGAAYLSSKLNADVYGAAETACFVSSGDQKALDVECAIEAGLYPEGYSVKAVRVHELKDGESIKLGDDMLHVIYSPGHSAGHCCYLYKNNLFSGDVLSADGKIALQAIWDCDLQSYIKTILKLQKLRIEGFYPGHGAFSVARGYRHFDAAAERIKRLWLPKNSIGE